MNDTNKTLYFDTVKPIKLNFTRAKVFELKTVGNELHYELLTEVVYFRNVSQAIIERRMKKLYKFKKIVVLDYEVESGRYNVNLKDSQIHKIEKEEGN